jgi:hypothetical protein
MIAPEGYERLGEVFELAIEQAAKGKGRKRHSNGEPFDKQQICWIPKQQGSVDFCTGQAVKKCLEINRLIGISSRIDELLGAINYIAAAIIVLQDQQAEYDKFKDSKKEAEEKYPLPEIINIEPRIYRRP